MWALGPHSLAGHYLQRSEKEKEKMNKQDSSSLENYDVRPSHKASDKIRLDPSGSILIAAFRLNRHSPQVQNNLENLFWLLSCVPASPVCFGLWSVTQRKEMLVACRLHTEEGDARGTQVALTYEQAWGLDAPLLSWWLGTAPSVPTRWYTATGESWILGRTSSSTLTYQPYALASDLKGMCSPPHGGHWGSDNVLRAHLFKLGLPVSDLWQPLQVCFIMTLNQTLESLPFQESVVE